MEAVNRLSSVASRLWTPVQKLTDRRILLIVGGALALLALLWLSARSLKIRTKDDEPGRLFNAGIQLKQINNAGAIGRFKEALACQPTPPLRHRIYLQLASSYCQSLQQDGIAFMLQQLAQTTDPDHRAMILEAHASILLSIPASYQESLELYFQARSIAKDLNLWAYLQLQYGKAAEIENPDFAMVQYTQALSARKSDPHVMAELHFRRGRIFQEKNNLEEAISDYVSARSSFRVAETQNPNMGALICLNLFFCQKIKNTALLQEGIELKPSDPALLSQLYLVRGFEYFEMKDYSSALACYENALKNPPQDISFLTEVHYRIGECYCTMDRPNVAIVALNTGLELPITSDLTLRGQDFRQMLYGLKGSIYYHQRKPTEAFNTYTAGIEAIKQSNPADLKSQAALLALRASFSPTPLQDLQQAWSLLLPPSKKEGVDILRTQIASKIAEEMPKEKALQFFRKDLDSISDPIQKSKIEKAIKAASQSFKTK